MAMVVSMFKQKPLWSYLRTFGSVECECFRRGFRLLCVFFSLDVVVVVFQCGCLMPMVLLLHLHSFIKSKLQLSMKHLVIRYSGKIETSKAQMTDVKTATAHVQHSYTETHIFHCIFSLCAFIESTRDENFTHTI